MEAAVNLPAEELYKEIEQALLAAKTDQATLYKAVVEEPFRHDRAMALLFLGFISFFVVDAEQEQVVVAGVTHNDYYKQSVANYDFKPSDYKLPMTSKDNSVIQAITTGQPVSSDNWDTFRRPDIEEGVARLNQADSGIGYSVVYPVEGKVKGALMFNFYQFPEAIGDAQEGFMQKYTELVSQALS
jgi:hypothetical protein